MNLVPIIIYDDVKNLVTQTILFLVVIPNFILYVTI